MGIPSVCRWGETKLCEEGLEAWGRNVLIGVLRLRLGQNDASDFAQDDELVAIGSTTPFGDFRNRFKPGKVQQAELCRFDDAFDGT